MIPSLMAIINLPTCRKGVLAEILGKRVALLFDISRLVSIKVSVTGVIEDP